VREEKSKKRTTNKQQFKKNLGSSQQKMAHKVEAPLVIMTTADEDSDDGHSGEEESKSLELGVMSESMWLENEKICKNPGCRELRCEGRNGKPTTQCEKHLQQHRTKVQKHYLKRKQAQNQLAAENQRYLAQVVALQEEVKRLKEFNRKPRP
jgi:hypothetical protein